MSVTILDIIEYLEGIYFDIQNADLISLAPRILLTFLSIVVTFHLVRYLWRIVCNTFGFLFRWVYWVVWKVVTAPYYIPRNLYFRWKYSRMERVRKKQWQALIKQNQQRHAEQEERERKIFDEIMK